MEKIAYRNKFRIVTKHGDILALNSTVNKIGTVQAIQGFSKREEAESTLRLYCMAANLDEKEFIIESYSESYSLNVPIIKDEAVNKAIARRKLFSGKGLKYNGSIPPKEENKYRPDKFYTTEIWLAQSTERNKGTSLVSRKGDGRKFKNAGVADTDTFEKMERLKPHNTTINSPFFDGLIPKLKLMGFNNRKELREYLHPRGFSNRIIDSIDKQLKSM